MAAPQVTSTAPSHIYWPGRRNRVLKYVLLEHTKAEQPPHFDILLDTGVDKPQARNLWALECEVNPIGLDKFDVSLHGMHRDRYLTYQGDVGHGRGFVRRLGEGEYTASSRDRRFTVKVLSGCMKGDYVVFVSGRARHTWSAAE